jgi:hypothetical protein
MDQDRARALLRAEREDVQGLIKDSESAGQEDRQSEVDSEAGDFSDAAQPLTAQGEDDAITESLRARLDAIDRALHRLDERTAALPSAVSRSRTSAWRQTPPRNSPSKKLARARAVNAGRALRLRG